jgi:ABC-type nickel/cobalt efflux system permease component RcnA
MLKTIAVLALTLLASLALMPPSSKAQTSPFQAPGIASSAAAPVATAEPGITSRRWAAILTEQSKLNRQLAASVKDLKQGGALHAALTLVLIAFLYGVLHAAGPGHGKAVISAYVLANEETVRRGIALSFLAALFQALSAILFVGVLAILLNRTSIEMRHGEAFIETVSWALVALVGAVLLYRRIMALLPARDAAARIATSPPRREGHGGGPSHAHDHHGCRHDRGFDRGAHAIDGDHLHSPDCGCGHAHIPSPQQVAGPEWSWRKAIPIALSVGIRPCSGALLLLIFALSQGLLWAGILGTFAMACLRARSPSR